MRSPRTALLAAALLAALLAPACGPAPEVGPAGLDLLELLPPDTEPAELRLAGVKWKRWAFDDGLPREWRVGPDTTGVERRPGGLRFAGSPSPWVELRAAIDPLRYEKLVVVFEEGEGEAAELYYSYDRPPVFRLAGRVESTPASRAAPHERHFLLPHPDGAERRLEAFRLYPGGRPGVPATVKKVSLVPRRDGFIAEAILSRERIDLEQEYRRCWRFIGGGERQVTFRVPAAGAVLRFGSGTLIGGGEARLRLAASAPGGGEAVLLDEPFGPRGRGWADHCVDLGRWAGRELTLSFRVTPTAGFGAIRLVGAPMVRRPGGAERPNVVLLVLDTLRADRLSAWGRPERITPHLDRLARRGLLFGRARATSSWTVPSTAALITGRYPDVPGVERGKAPAVAPDSATLAERFADHGYVTGGFSANFVLDGFRGFHRGFDTWYLAPYQDARLTAAELNQRALHWARAQGEGPLFLYLHYMDPHEPYDAPSIRRPHGRAGPFSIERGHRWRDGTILPLLMGWDELEGPEERELIEGWYHEEVAYLDRCIGRFFASLRAAGLLENTVLLVTADHGEEFGDHGFWSHGFSLYREMLHVPLLLTSPVLGPGAGTVEPSPVSLLDITPTLLSLAGLPPPHGPAHGRSLLDPSPQRTLFAATAACGLPPRYSAFDGRYALVRIDPDAAGAVKPGSRAARWLDRAAPPAVALYDLEADPAERHNLAAELPAVASRLSRALETQFPQAAQAGDPATAGAADLERLRALGYIQ